MIKRPHPRLRQDHGAGLIGAISGVLVVLALLLFAMQLLMNLYTTSVVTSAAHEGARMVAGSRIDHGDPWAVAAAQARADERMREQLGRYGEQVDLDWSASTPDTVVLRVRAEPPGFLLPGLPARLGFDEVDRTIEARVEQLR